MLHHISPWNCELLLKAFLDNCNYGRDNLGHKVKCSVRALHIGNYSDTVRYSDIFNQLEIETYWEFCPLWGNDENWLAIFD